MLTWLKLCALRQVWGAVHTRPGETETARLQEVCWPQRKVRATGGGERRCRFRSRQGQEQGRRDFASRRREAQEGQEVGGGRGRRRDSRGGGAIEVRVRRVREPSVPGPDGSTCRVDGRVDRRGTPDEAGTAFRCVI